MFAKLKWKAVKKLQIPPTPFRIREQGGFLLINRDRSRQSLIRPLQFMGEEPLINPGLPAPDLLGEAKNILLEIERDYIIGGIDFLRNGVAQLIPLGFVHNLVRLIH